MPASRFQFRRANASAWTASNPTLAAGELGYELDTGKFKIGNGSTAWNSLVYAANSSGIETLTNKTISLGSNIITGTLEQFNSALSDQDFATLAGTETLTNKTFPSLTVFDSVNDNPSITVTDSTGINYTTVDDGYLEVGGTNSYVYLWGNGEVGRWDGTQTSYVSWEGHTHDEIIGTTYLYPYDETATQTFQTIEFQDEFKNALVWQSGQNVSIGGLRWPLGFNFIGRTVSVLNASVPAATLTLRDSNSSSGYLFDFGGSNLVLQSGEAAFLIFDGSRFRLFRNFATLAGTETLTNKTLNLGSNTITGTLLQFNSALTDQDFATLAGTETLTNKTLTAPNIGAATGTSLSLTGTISAAALGGSLLSSTAPPSLSGIASAGNSTIPARSNHQHGTVGLVTTSGGTTGSGSVVYNNSPTLVTPQMGTAGFGIAGSTGTTTIVTAAAASGTVLIPAGAGTLATLAGNETLTNKTLTAGTINFNTGAITTTSGAISTSTGTVSGAHISSSGSIVATGTVSAAVVAATGNSTVGGSLTVTSTIGASGLAGSLLSLSTPADLTSAGTYGVATVPARSDHAHPTTNLLTTLTTSTGIGGTLVYSGSPTLVSPSLGTPGTAILTNATGLPISTGLTGFTTKGDLVVYTGSAVTRFGTGGSTNNGLVLTADSTTTEGVVWASPAPSIATQIKWGLV